MLRLRCLTGWIWACFIYSKDGVTGVRGEQRCASSFPLDVGFPCRKVSDSSRIPLFLQGRRRKEQKSMWSCPISLPPLLSVSWEVCRKGFLLCQLVSPSNLKVKLYLHLLVDNFNVWKLSHLLLGGFIPLVKQVHPSEPRVWARKPPGCWLPTVSTCFFWLITANTIQASGLTDGWVVQGLASGDCHLPFTSTTCWEVQQFDILGFLSFCTVKGMKSAELH